MLKGMAAVGLQRLCILLSTRRCCTTYMPGPAGAFWVASCPPAWHGMRASACASCLVSSLPCWLPGPQAPHQKLHLLAGRCQRLPCREATTAEIEACHDPGLAHHLAQVSQQAAALEAGPEAAAQALQPEQQAAACVHLTPDTFANRHTSLCARLAAGASIDAAVAVAR